MDKKIIKLTEAQLQEIVRRVLKEVLGEDGVLGEMADHRSYFVRKCNDYADIIYTHIAKICISRQLHFSEETITHWQNEISAALVNILGSGLVDDNSGKKRAKAFRDVFVYGNLGANYSGLVEVMEGYFIQAMEDEGFSEEEINGLDIKQMVTEKSDDIRNLMDSLISCAGSNKKQSVSEVVYSVVYNF